jgi:hypothetical protein
MMAKCRRIYCRLAHFHKGQGERFIYGNHLATGGNAYVRHSNKASLFSVHSSVLSITEIFRKLNLTLLIYGFLTIPPTALYDGSGRLSDGDVIAVFFAGRGKGAPGCGKQLSARAPLPQVSHPGLKTNRERASSFTVLEGAKTHAHGIKQDHRLLAGCAKQHHGNAPFPQMADHVRTANAGGYGAYKIAHQPYLRLPAFPLHNGLEITQAEDSQAERNALTGGTVYFVIQPDLEIGLPAPPGHQIAEHGPHPPA